MPSKYDYPDPGQDPAYCNGLAPEREDMVAPLTCNVCWVDITDTQSALSRTRFDGAPALCADCVARELTPESDDPPDWCLDICDWCGKEYDSREYYPYCSSPCGLYAERDDRPPRTLTRQERLEGLADRGVDTWEERQGER